MNWLTDNAAWLAPVAAWLVLTTLNAILRRVELSRDARSWLLVVVDVLSGWSNRDSPATAKLPLTRSPKPPGGDPVRKRMAKVTDPYRENAPGAPEPPVRRWVGIDEAARDAARAMTRWPDPGWFVAVVIPALVAAIVLFDIIALSGCGGWQQTAARSVQAAYAGTVTLEQASLDVLDARCLATAKACTKPPPDCAALTACQAKRRKLAAGIRALYQAIDAARIAVLAALAADGAEGARAKALTAAAQLVADLDRLRGLARTLGVSL